MERTGDSKKKVTLAIAASILFHVFLLFFFAIWMEIRGSDTPPPRSTPEKALELTFLPEEAPDLAIAPTPTPERENIRTDNFTEAATPPPDASFDSDRDTAAGGEKPGAGPKDLPNVEGRDSGDLALQDQQVALGGKSAPAGPATPQTEATPEPTPQPTPPTEVAKIDPQPLALPTPEPLLENEIAVGRATPAATPVPRPPAPPTGGGQAYQPERRATRIEGNLSNRGRPSIATRGTPLGRYLRQVENAIGSRWYFYIKRDADMVAPGAVRIIFTIDRAGKVGNLRILSNTSNESFAYTSTQSIMEAEFPPIPDDVASTLYTQRLELPFTFTIY